MVWKTIYLSLGLLLLNSCGNKKFTEFPREKWLNETLTNDKENASKSARGQDSTAGALGKLSPLEPGETEKVIQPVGLSQDSQAILERELAVDLTWWKSLRDKNIPILLQTALRDNLDMEVIQARLRAAKAEVRRSGADLWPDISVGAGLNKSETASKKNATEINSYGKSRKYNVNLEASYEIDLWGKNFKIRKASHYAYLSTAYGKAVSERTLLSNVAGSYLDLLLYMELEKSTNEIYELTNDQLVIAEKKLELGSYTKSDVLTARNNLEIAKRSLSQYQLQRATELNQLKLLLGLSTQKDLPVKIGKNRLVELWEPDETFIILSKVIARRPDIIAAQADLEAATLKVGIAKRNFLPKFAISGGLIYSDRNLNKVLSTDNLLYNLVTNLTAPIFQGGELAASYEIAKADYEEKVASYKATVLSAIKEVQDALLEVESQRQQFKALTREYRNAQANYELEQSKYDAGSIEYSELLQERSQLLQAKMSWLQGKVSFVKSIIKLHKASGEI